MFRTAPCTASVTSTNRTERRNAISGTPASAHAATIGSGTRSRQVEPSSTATAAAPCSITDPIQRLWSCSRAARADPRGEHELAALEQVARIGHLDHVRPPQLAIEAVGAGDHLRQRTPDHRQLEDLTETKHTFRQSFWKKTRRCVHCSDRCDYGKVALLVGGSECP